MRDLAKCGGTGIVAAPRLPKGIAFDIPDLVLARNWAVASNSRMAVRLDHGADDEEYEEVIDLYTGKYAASHLIMWRNPTAVFIQPLPGRQQRFGSVAKALASILPKQRSVLSDIFAAAWHVD